MKSVTQQIQDHLQLLQETIEAIQKTYPDSSKVHHAGELFADVLELDTQFRSAMDAADEFVAYHYIQASRYFVLHLVDTLSEVFQQQDVGVKYLSQSYVDKLNSDWVKLQKSNPESKYVLAAQTLKLSAAKKIGTSSADQVLRVPGAVDILIHAFYCGDAHAATIVRELQLRITRQISIRPSKVNPHLSKGPLIPAVAPGTIAEMAAHVWPKKVRIASTSTITTTITTKSKFAAMCKQNKVNLILIHCMTPHQTRYNIFDITDVAKTEAYMRQYGKQSGVNLAMIDRNRTSEQNYSSSRKWDLKVEDLVRVSAFTKTLILEQLDQNTFWILSNDFATFLVDQDVVDQIDLEIRLRELTSKHSEAAILPRMFLQVKPDLKRIEHRSNTDIEVDVIRNDIYFAVHKILLGAKKRILKSDTPAEELGAVVHSGEIEEQFESIINTYLNRYLSKIKSVYSRDGLPVAEMLLTFDNSLYMYKRDLRKKIHDDYTQAINSGLDEEKLTAFAEKVAKDVSELISNDTNIYQNMILKLMLHKRFIFDN